MTSLRHALTHTMRVLLTQHHTHSRCIYGQVLETLAIVARDQAGDVKGTEMLVSLPPQGKSQCPSHCSTQSFTHAHTVTKEAYCTQMFLQYHSTCFRRSNTHTTIRVCVGRSTLLRATRGHVCKIDASCEANPGRRYRLMCTRRQTASRIHKAP
jgi:hypothetical protein